MMKHLLHKFAVKIYVLLKGVYYTQRYADYRKKYTISKSFEFNGEDIYLYGNGEIHLGGNSYIGSYSTLQCCEEANITIGDFCSLSHNVRIYTKSNDPNQNFINNQNKIKKTGSVTIGDGVWIGANVFINPGVTIGDNSVIGANSVVTKDVDSNAIYAGVPAVFIKKKTPHA